MQHPFSQSPSLQYYLTDDRVKRLPGSGQSPEVVRKPLYAAAAPYASHTECGNEGPALLPRGEREEFEGEPPHPSLAKGIKQKTSLLEGTIQRNHEGDVFDAGTGEVLMAGYHLPIGVGCTSTGELWQNTIGVEIDQESWDKGHDQDCELKSQTEAIARRLESQGIKAYQEDNNTTVIGLCSGVAEKTTNYRNSNLLPVQQSKNVHNILQSVKYITDYIPKKQMRMLVISNGWVPLPEYNEEHRAFGRQISKLAADPVVKAHGVEFIYFNIENTIHRIDGTPHLNMHSHILVKSTRRLGAKKWKNFMNWMKSRFSKGYVHDERIRNVSECVKYVFKPSEFDQLTDPELAELFCQCFKLKFYHPLGELKSLRKKLKEDGLKLVRMPSERANEWKWHLMPKAKANPKQERNNSGACNNIVVAITNPMPKFSPRREPCIVVKDYNGDFEGLIRNRNLADLRDQAMEIWRARASMKHTTTTTVRDHDDRQTSFPEFPEFAHFDDPPRQKFYNQGVLQ